MKKFLILITILIGLLVTPGLTKAAEPIYSLSVSGSGNITAEKGYIRIILTTESGQEYLVYEAGAPLDRGSVSFENHCEETCVLDGVVPDQVKTVYEGASVNVSKVHTLKDKSKLRGKIEENIQKKKEEIDKKQEQIKQAKVDNYMKEKKIEDLPYAADEILIKTNSGQSQAFSVAQTSLKQRATYNLSAPLVESHPYPVRKTGAKQIEKITSFGTGQWYKVKLDQKTDPLVLSSNIQRKAEITAAQPNFIFKKTAIPNDPYFSSSGAWDQHYQDQWDLKMMNVSKGWDISKGSSNITVAVLDTGIDTSHPDLQGKTVTGKTFVGGGVDDKYGHGTHVAGTIAAATNNNKGMAGVGWKTKVMPVKVLNSEGKGKSEGIVEGTKYAADQGADVINMSLEPIKLHPVIKYWSEAIDYAEQKGTVVVAAAGNSSRKTWTSMPANHPQVISVGALDFQGEATYYSNYGYKTDIWAPGGKGFTVLSLRAEGTDLIYKEGVGAKDEYVIDKNYYLMRGTSMAAPHIAGVVALMRSVNPSITFEQIETILTKRFSASVNERSLTNLKQVLNATQNPPAINRNPGKPAVNYDSTINFNTNATFTIAGFSDPEGGKTKLKFYWKSPNCFPEAPFYYNCEYDKPIWETSWLPASQNTYHFVRKFAVPKYPYYGYVMAFDKNGGSSYISEPIEVHAERTPRIQEFKAKPAHIEHAGDSVKLEWDTNFAIFGGRCNIEADSGDFQQNAQPRGQTTVHPEQATTYNLICSAPDVEKSKSVHVSMGEVNPLQASCSASPNPAKTGQLVTFESSVSGGPGEHTGDYSYRWKKPCSGRVTESCPWNYDEPGNYTAKLVVTSGEQKATTTCPVEINAGEAPQVSVSLSAEKKSNTAPTKVDLKANVTGGSGNIDYKFDCTNDGNWEVKKTTSDTFYTATNACDYETEGNYTAKVKVERSSATATDKTTINVSSGGPTAPTCEQTKYVGGEPPTFRAKGDNINQTKLEIFNLNGNPLWNSDWSSEETISWSGKNNEGQQMSAGSYLAQTTVKNQADSEKCPTVKFWYSGEEPENEPPTASFSYDPSDPDVNQQIAFDASDSSDDDGSIDSYQWDFGDNSSGSGQTTTHTYNSGGNYTVTLTVTDNDGATDSTSKSINVQPETQPSGSLSCGNTTQDSITIHYNYSNCDNPALYRENNLIENLASGSGSGTSTDSELSSNTGYTYYLKENETKMDSVPCSTNEETEMTIDLPECPFDDNNSGIYIWNPDCSHSKHCEIGTECGKECGVGWWSHHLSTGILDDGDPWWRSYGDAVSGWDKAKWCKIGNDTNKIPACPTDLGEPGTVWVASGWMIAPSSASDWENQGCKVGSDCYHQEDNDDIKTWGEEEYTAKYTGGNTYKENPYGYCCIVK